MENNEKGNKIIIWFKELIEVFPYGKYNLIKLYYYISILNLL